jgi:hypothetical protein
MPITNKAPPQPHLAPKPTEADIEADYWREIQALEEAHRQEIADIEAESIGWMPLEPGAYLHTASDDLAIIDIVGIATASMDTNNVLWLL